MKSVPAFLSSRAFSIGLIVLLYVPVASHIFSTHGVKLSVDSVRYLGYAKNLQEGFYFDKLNFWSFTYVLFIYAHQLFSDSHNVIILSQYLLGFLAVLALYRATDLLSGDTLTGLFAAGLFIVFPDNLLWHSLILAESIYGSLLCFWLYAFVSFRASRKPLFAGLLVVITLLCFFVKPTSPALIIAFLAPTVVQFLWNPAHRVAKIAGSVIVAFAVLALANQMLSQHAVLRSYAKGDIIFAMHTMPHHPQHDLLTITPPADLYLPDEDGALVWNMLRFIVYNPVFYAQLVLSKVFLYITHLRPYWSLGHNLAVIFLLGPSYYFAATTLRKKLIAQPLIQASIVYCSIHLLIVSNTWVDWDARFFVPLYPLIALLAAVGLRYKMSSWFGSGN